MSEDKPDEEYSESKKVEITIKKSQKDTDEKSQLEAQNQDLKTENADIKAQLETIAEQEFTRRKEQVITRGRKVGLTISPDSILEPENLVSYIQIVKQREGEDAITSRNKPSPSGVPLTGYQTGENTPDQSGKRIEDRTYENLEEMMKDLEKEKILGNQDATRVLTKLTKKALKKGIDAEFMGDLPKIAGQVDPVKDKGKSKEQIEAERQAEANRWRESD